MHAILTCHSLSFSILSRLFITPWEPSKNIISICVTKALIHICHSKYWFVFVIFYFGRYCNWTKASPWLTGLSPRDLIMPTDGDDGFFPIRNELVFSSKFSRVFFSSCWLPSFLCLIFVFSFLQTWDHQCELHFMSYIHVFFLRNLRSSMRTASTVCMCWFVLHLTLHSMRLYCVFYTQVQNSEWSQLHIAYKLVLVYRDLQISNNM